MSGGKKKVLDKKKWSKGTDITDILEVKIINVINKFSHCNIKQKLIQSNNK